MQVGQFPASAANSLIQGYCDDFVSLAAILAQTLEQISMRGLNFDSSRPALLRIENGMRNLSDAIHELLAQGKVSADLSSLNAGQTLPAPPQGQAAPARPAGGQGPARGNPAAAPAPAAPPPRPANAAGPVRPAGAPAQAQTPPTQPAAARTPTPPARTQSSGTATSMRNGPPRPASEGLKGTSQSMPLLSVFQFLGRMRKAGTMRVALATENLTFELHNGSILGTTSTQSPRQELLGELLVERGCCTAEDVATLARKANTTNNEQFGQLAIEARLVTEAQVIEALELQASRRYARACKSQDARYEFVEGLRSTAESRFRTPPIPVA